MKPFNLWGDYQTVHLDGADVAFTADAISALFAEKKRQFQELSGRLDAKELELEKEKAARAELEARFSSNTNLKLRSGKPKKGFILLILNYLALQQ